MRAFVFALLVGLGLLVAGGPAFAATVTEPSGDAVKVGVDDEGYAAAFTVKANGFDAYENVFVEMCNGRPPTAENWSPTIDCDLGSSPAAAVADADGVVTFSADDPNHSLFPFVGPSPQELFQCFAPGATGPARAGMESYTNCQLRISTSNNEATDDQVFVSMVLPKEAKVGWRSPTFPTPAGATGQSPSSEQSGESTARSAAGNEAATNSDGTTSDASSGSSSSSDFPVLPVVLSALVVAGAAVLLVLYKRRSGRVAA